VKIHVRTRPKTTAGSVSTRINGERAEKTRSNLKRTSIATCSLLHSIAAFLSYLRNPRNDLYHGSKIHLYSREEAAAWYINRLVAVSGLRSRSIEYSTFASLSQLIRLTEDDS